MRSAFRDTTVATRAVGGPPGDPTGPPGARIDVRLRAAPDRLGPFRRHLENFLAAHGVPEGDAFDLVVATSEATANAIEHPVHPAEPFVNVTAEIAGDCVTVTVRDTGQWRHSSDTPFRGRGLSLIGSLAHLQVDHQPRGTTLTLRRSLRARPGTDRRGAR
jgi:anti-sigma regulatory factor (Ser/Thr protein kinase)